MWTVCYPLTPAQSGVGPGIEPLCGAQGGAASDTNYRELRGARGEPEGRDGRLTLRSAGSFTSLRLLYTVCDHTLMQLQQKSYGLVLFSWLSVCFVVPWLFWKGYTVCSKFFGCFFLYKDYALPASLHKSKWIVIIFASFHITISDQETFLFHLRTELTILSCSSSSAFVHFNCFPVVSTHIANQKWIKQSNCGQIKHTHSTQHLGLLHSWSGELLSLPTLPSFILLYAFSCLLLSSVDRSHVWNSCWGFISACERLWVCVEFVACGCLKYSTTEDIQRHMPKHLCHGLRHRCALTLVLAKVLSAQD